MSEHEKPDYKVFTPVGEGFATKWIEVGGGWTKTHPDGHQYISISLNAMPLNGRLIISDRNLPQRRKR